MSNEWMMMAKDIAEAKAQAALYRWLRDNGDDGLMGRLSVAEPSRWEEIIREDARLAGVML